jgi:hypothetical protein
VDVFRRALQFGEDAEIVPGILSSWMRDLEQDRAVALDNQGAVRHSFSV